MKQSSLTYLKDRLTELAERKKLEIRNTVCKSGWYKPEIAAKLWRDRTQSEMDNARAVKVYFGESLPFIPDAEILKIVKNNAIQRIRTDTDDLLNLKKMQEFEKWKDKECAAYDVQFEERVANMQGAATKVMDELILGDEKTAMEALTTFAKTRF